MNNAHNDIAGIIMRRLGIVGMVAASQIAAPIEIMKIYWDRQYDISNVEILEGAALDPNASAHLIRFAGTVNGRQIEQCIVLNVENGVLVTPRTHPDFLKLPYRHHGSALLGVMAIGIIPATFTAIAGLPIYALRKLQLKKLAQDAEVFGLTPEQQTFLKAVADQLTPDVYRLLRKAFIARSEETKRLERAILGGYESLKAFLATCDQEIETRPAEKTTYTWLTPSGAPVAFIGQNTSETDPIYGPAGFFLDVSGMRHLGDSPLKSISQVEIESLTSVYRQRIHKNTPQE